MGLKFVVNSVKVKYAHCRFNGRSERLC